MTFSHVANIIDQGPEYTATPTPKEFLEMDIFVKCSGYIPEMSTLVLCDVVSLVVLNLYRIFRLCTHKGNAQTRGLMHFIIVYFINVCILSAIQRQQIYESHSLLLTMQAQILYPLRPYNRDETHGLNGSVNVIMLFIIMVGIKSTFDLLSTCKCFCKLKNFKGLVFFWVGTLFLCYAIYHDYRDKLVSKTSICHTKSNIPLLPPQKGHLFGIIRSNRTGSGHDISPDYFCINLPYDIRYNKEFAKFLPFWDSWEQCPYLT